MAYSQTRIGRARIRPQTDWGFDNAVAAGSFVAGDTLGCEVWVPQLVEEALRSETFRGAFHAHRVVGGSRKGVQITVSMPAHGLSSSAPSGEPTRTPDILLFESALGFGAATTAGFDATNLVGGTAASVQWTDATGLNPGQALLIPLASGHSFGWLQTITPGTPEELVLVTELSGAPAASGQVFGSYGVALSTAQSAPLSLLWVGSRGEQIRLYDGAVSQAQLTREPSGRLMISATLQFGGWIVDAGSGTAPGQYAFGLPDLPAAIGRNGARVMVDGAAIPLSSFELSITNTLAEAPDIGAREGLGAYVTTDRAVQLTVTGRQPDVSALRSPGDELGTVQVDCGNTPGKALSLLMPAAVVQEFEPLQDSEGVVGNQLTLAPGNYTGDGSSTEPGNTVFRMAWS